jgi:serine/threonine-protein kinase HipA
MTIKPARLKSLTVWMNGEPVAIWKHSANDQQELNYLPSWLESSSARPLSLSLPFTPGNRSHRGDSVRNFFDNLLPDNDDILKRLRLKYRTISTDSFDLLGEIGRDCVGAIQLLPEDRAPEGIREIHGSPLKEAGIERLLKAVTRKPVLGQEMEDADLRISIAGAQEKTALLWHENRWQRPQGATPSTHIFKLPLGMIGNGDIDFSTSVENEWLCAQILSAYEVPIASCSMEQFGDEKVLVVERFDRRLADDKSWWIRLPQEDFCQALGVSPRQKYEAEGGPGVARILEILGNSTERDHDRRQFYRSQILFWMLAATDGHAKNFSIFLAAGGNFRMTPLYDVLSFLPADGRKAGKLQTKRLKLAMAVRSSNTHHQIGEIQRRHWNEMARRCGLGLDAEDLIIDLIERTPAVIAKVESALPKGFPDEVAQPILSGLLKSSQRLAAMPAQARNTH